MPIAKGTKLNPNGRPKGVPNKATTDARAAIADFVSGNVERLNGWLDRIADDNPKAAFDCFMSVIEYNIPKLARTEVANPEGDTFKTSVEISSTDKALLERYGIK